MSVGSEWYMCDRTDCLLQVVGPGTVQCSRRTCPATVFQAPDRLVFHVAPVRAEPGRWAAWCDKAPATTGYGATPGEAVDNVTQSEDMHEVLGEVSA